MLQSVYGNWIKKHQWKLYWVQSADILNIFFSRMLFFKRENKFIKTLLMWGSSCQKSFGVVNNLIFILSWNFDKGSLYRISIKRYRPYQLTIIMRRLLCAPSYLHYRMQRQTSNDFFTDEMKLSVEPSGHWSIDIFLLINNFLSVKNKIFL